jgi:homoserine/homoserine lactone efflux protein
MMTSPVLCTAISVLKNQFVMKESPFWPQATILIALFSLLLILIHSAYAVIATAARGALQGTRASLIINRISGILFIALGLMVFAKILSGFF